MSFSTPIHTATRRLDRNPALTSSCGHCWFVLDLIFNTINKWRGEVTVKEANPNHIIKGSGAKPSQANYKGNKNLEVTY